MVPLFHVYDNCEGIWSHGQHLYTNDIVCLHTIIITPFIIQKGDSDMVTYLGKVISAVTDFNIILPITANVTKQQTHRDRLFMLLT